MVTTYRDAAQTLWGEAGTYVHDAYQHWLPLFDNLPPELPVVIGLSAYGACAGLTRFGGEGLDGPRISIATQYFDRGAHEVRDTMLHEMMHVSLGLAGKAFKHDSRSWYAECNRLAPHVLGRELGLEYGPRRKSVRVRNPDWTPENGLPKSLVRKVPVEVAVAHADIARFPHPFRPDDFDRGRVILVPTY